MSYPATIHDFCERWAKAHFGEVFLSRTTRSSVRGLRVNRREDNFFGRLTKRTHEEFRKADGGELNSTSFALHSSPVLAVNFFQFWRETGQAGVVAGALFGDPSCTDLKFEAKHPTGVSRSGKASAANLDVEFSGGRQPWAVEAKFCEPYGAKPKKFLRDACLAAESTPMIWKSLPNCLQLAKQAQDREPMFKYLDAAQLLKHVLALTKEYGPNAFGLVYLWYDASEHLGADDIDRHKEEIEQFAERIRDDVCFHSKTYQEVFAALADSGKNSGEYFACMKQRYFPNGS